MPPQADAPAVYNRARWRRGDGEQRQWLVLPEVWKDLCRPFDYKAVARMLADLDMLRPNEKGHRLPRSERIPHGTKRVYVVTARILEEDRDAA